MADCGSLIGQIAALQTQIDDDNAQLKDPHLCDGPPPLSKEQCKALRDNITADRDGAIAQRDALQRQLPPVCSLLVGTWQVDANGSDGQLTIDTVDSATGQGLIGHMALFDQAGSPPDNINGSWDDVAKVIRLTRSNPDPNSTAPTQAFTGFLGDNHADQFVILAGWFEESDIPNNAPRTQFGWFARK